eukprot:258260_1
MREVEYNKMTSPPPVSPEASPTPAMVGMDKVKTASVEDEAPESPSSMIREYNKMMTPPVSPEPSPNPRKHTNDTKMIYEKPKLMRDPNSRGSKESTPSDDLVIYYEKAQKQQTGRLQVHIEMPRYGSNQSHH